MNVPRIQIDQQFTRIQSHTQPRRFELTNTWAKLDAEHTNPRVELNRTPPRVLIDQTAARASVGYRTSNDLEEDFASRAMQYSYEHIARKAAEGDRIGAIENRSDPIPDIAWENAFPEGPELTIASLPGARPQFQYQPGRVDAQYVPGDIRYHVTPGRVQGDYQPSRVITEVVQKGYVKVIPPPPKLSLQV
ncbi:hypothetical protein GTO89_08390 [Heliobacterium gestii]|uniref:Uncharacterized protein n=1 Tax=Heliomicrobium gestii TaxID=2699 RepID=A0A845LHX3_HELGE|nr:DUF6470 family protein [Heliomicrobium gestii]MBM7866667.1 hypothetical protein [Heliomicrobium gestii]MZP43053.1 hypothetical protein [Heliomicrobium gestii]